MMKTAALKFRFRPAAAALLLSMAVPMAVLAGPASAQDAHVLAYAPVESGASVFDHLDRNSALQADEYDEFEEHELNDAWLGMPVRSSDGFETGWVSDAILDRNGNVITVIVDFNGKSHAVDARHAELGDDAVAVSLTQQRIATLGSVTPRYEVGQAAPNPMEQFAERIRAAFRVQ